MNAVSAFQESEIRGKYPEEMDERLAFLVGKSLAVWKKPKRVAIASGIHRASPRLKSFLADGLSLYGVAVTDLLEIPVPQFYFSTVSGNFDLGIMITDGAEENGINSFKIISSTGLPLDGSELATLQVLVREHAKEPIVHPRPDVQIVSTTHSYIEALLAHVDASKIASSHCQFMVEQSTLSTAILFLSKELQLLPGGWTFILNREGERIFVQESGRVIVEPEILIGTLGISHLRTHGGGKVILDSGFSLPVCNLLKAEGAQLEVFRDDIAYFKFGMWNDPKIIFAGSKRGIAVYRDFFLIEDGLLAALRFLEMGASSNDLLDRVRASRKQSFRLPEFKFSVSSEALPEKLARLTEHFRNHSHYEVFVDGHLIIMSDNLKATFKPSGKQGVLTANFEARFEQDVKGLVNTVEKVLDI